MSAQEGAVPAPVEALFLGVLLAFEQQQWDQSGAGISQLLSCNPQWPQFRLQQAKLSVSVNAFQECEMAVLGQ